jgi:hypothetical protein
VIPADLAYFRVADLMTNLKPGPDNKFGLPDLVPLLALNRWWRKMKMKTIMQQLYAYYFEPRRVPGITGCYKEVNSDGTEQIAQFPVIVASRFNHFLHKVTFGHLPRRGHLFKQNQAPVEVNKG